MYTLKKFYGFSRLFSEASILSACVRNSDLMVMSFGTGRAILCWKRVLSMHQVRDSQAGVPQATPESALL